MVGTRWRGWLLPFALLIVLGAAVTMSGAARPVLENLLSLALSAAAGAGCARAALRSAGRSRAGWWLIAFGCWSWAAGQAAWTVLQVLLGVELPFPSVADIGYGAFPICATFGLWRLTRGVSRLAMARRVIDGFTVGCSLGLAAWVFVLERLVDGDFASPLPEAASLFYPVTDTVLVTVAVLTIAQTRELTASSVLLGLGVLAMTLADFTFVPGRGRHVPDRLVRCMGLVAGLHVDRHSRAGSGVRRPRTPDWTPGGTGLRPGQPAALPAARGWCLGRQPRTKCSPSTSRIPRS